MIVLHNKKHAFIGDIVALSADRELAKVHKFIEVSYL